MRHVCHVVHGGFTAKRLKRAAQAKRDMSVSCARDPKVQGFSVTAVKHPNELGWHVRMLRSHIRYHPEIRNRRVGAAKR